MPDPIDGQVPAAANTDFVPITLGADEAAAEAGAAPADAQLDPRLQALYATEGSALQKISTYNTAERQKFNADAQQAIAGGADPKNIGLYANLDERDAHLASMADSYRKAGLSDDEIKALQLRQSRLKEQGDLNQTAKNEASVPTGLKPLVNVTKGVLKAADATLTMAGAPANLTGANDFPDVGGTTGAVTQSIAQFAIGMVGAGKFLKAAGILQGAGSAAVGFARLSLQGAIADVTVFDGHEQKLSNLLDAYPALQNPVTDFLRADPSDGQAEGRLKAATEGLLTGGALEVLSLSLKGLKGLRAAKAAGDPKIAATVAEQLGADIEAKLAAQKLAGEAAAQVPPTTGMTGSRAKVASTVYDGKIEGAKPVAPVPGEPRIGGDPTPRGPTELMSQELRDSIVQKIKDGGTDLSPRPNRDFNFETMDPADPEAVKGALNLMSDALAPDIEKATGGTISLKETSELADIIGNDPADLMQAISKDASTVSQQHARLVAGKEMLQSLARQVTTEAQAVSTGVAKTPDKLNKLLELTAQLHVNLKTVQTGAARTTSAGRIITGDAFSNEMLRVLAMADGNPQLVRQMLDTPSLARRTLNGALEYWYNCLLSGPKTHLVNILSSTINTGMRPLNRMIGGQFKEGLDEVVGMRMAWRDSWKMARLAFENERSFLNPGNLKADGQRFSLSSKNFNLKPESKMGATVDFLGKVARLPSRFLMAEDELLKQINYRGNLYAKATREGTEKGLKEGQLAEYVAKRVEDAFSGNGRALDEASLRQANIATFTEELRPGSIPSSINNMVNKHPALRVILTFVRTPTNLIRQFGQQFPVLQEFSHTFRADLAAGGERAAIAKGKRATGAMMAGSAALLAYGGMITGRGPNDPKMREAMKANGWKPYSIKIGDTYVDYGRVDPYGMFFGLAADIAEARAYVSDDDAESMAEALGCAVARNLTSKTYLHGMTGFLEALDSGEPGKIGKLMQSYAGSAVPFSSGMKAVAVSTDPTVREVRSMVDAIMARTPGLSDKLPAKRNFLGDTEVRPMGMGEGINPIAYSTDLHDDVSEELIRMNRGLSKPGSKINQRIDLLQYPGAGNETAYDRLLALRGEVKARGGRTLKEALTHEIRSESYKRLPDGTDEYSSAKMDRLKGVMGEYQEKAMKALRKEFPDLDKDMKADQDNVKAVKRRGPDALKPLTK